MPPSVLEPTTAVVVVEVVMEVVAVAVVVDALMLAHVSSTVRKIWWYSRSASCALSHSV